MCNLEKDFQEALSLKNLKEDKRDYIHFLQKSINRRFHCIESSGGRCKWRVEGIRGEAVTFFQNFLEGTHLCSLAWIILQSRLSLLFSLLGFHSAWGFSSLPPPPLPSFTSRTAGNWPRKTLPSFTNSFFISGFLDKVPYHFKCSEI